MQHCGCDPDIVKDEIHERASVLPYVYIDISNQPPRVHACTLVVVRMQDIVFPSDINFQDWDIGTYRIYCADVQLANPHMCIRESCSSTIQYY
jgi:hypothetical protein